MYKVVIVDDDRIIRRGLSSIPWEDIGFQLVGEASDGEMGLQVIAETCPHIVISDIKMPFMDGLEMAGSIKKNYPAIKVILLTGYDDFKYAQEAIKIRAFDYLLKPVDREVLIEKVKMAASELENEQKAQKQMNEGMPFLRQRFLKKLIHNQCRPDEIDKELEFLGVELKGPLFSAFLIKLDDGLPHTGEKKDDIFGSEILKFCVYNICEEILDEEKCGIVFDSDRDELVLIYSSNEVPETASQHMYALAERIRESVKMYLKKTVTIAMGRVHSNIPGISQAYEEARSAIEFRHLIGKDKVFSIADTGLPPNSNPDPIKGIENELLLKVKLGLSLEAFAVIEELKNQLLSQKYISLHHVRLMATQIIVLLFKEAEEWAEGWVDRHREDLTNHYHEINQLQTVAEIVKKLESVVTSLVSYVNMKREGQKNATVDLAMRFIEENYFKEGLSLQDVAKEVHISPTYLSILFKQEKNINFSDFLFETRMKKAMELLRHQNLKTYEVAEKVGYGNPQYFSVSFKKYTGYSPLEFKKQE
ncbi:response regulator [Ammoniphilus sp. 3BR4]|uniref:response regulator n=1 Tax=Ammoniphilus sp. 3BR4 TaxID=3158265 RepID=UPI0034674423